jgi:hypothetical protein
MITDTILLSKCEDCKKCKVRYKVQGKKFLWCYCFCRRHDEKQLVIEESIKATRNPWHAFVSLWKLITYFYPLLLSWYASKKYLKSGDRLLAKTKSRLSVDRRPKAGHGWGNLHI